MSAAVAARRMSLPAKRPRIGLALGGGGARGLAHILVLEAFDELGLKPDLITGTSIGAIYGAAYASGLDAKLIRAHTEETLGQRFDLVRQLFSARAEPVLKILSILPIRPALLDPDALLEYVLPSKVKRDFAELVIPLRIVATDFYAQEQSVLTSGVLRKAVAASMALPAIFTPVMIDGRAMVDGGLVNPLPFDVLAGAADITVAIDVSGAPRGEGVRAQPSAIEVLLASSQILQRSIIREKLKAAQPDIYVDCAVDAFTVLDFHKFRDVLKSAAPAKDQLKRQLMRLLESQIAEPLPVLIDATPERTKKRGGRLAKLTRKRR
jgi:NTE family protein